MRGGERCSIVREDLSLFLLFVHSRAGGPVHAGNLREWTETERKNSEILREMDNWTKELWIINGTKKSDFLTTSVVYYARSIARYIRSSTCHPFHRENDANDANDANEMIIHASISSCKQVGRAPLLVSLFPSLHRYSFVSIERSRLLRLRRIYENRKSVRTVSSPLSSLLSR